MRLFESFRGIFQRGETLVNEAAQLREQAPLTEQLEAERNNVELLTERLAELELAIEDAGWQKLSADGDKDFSRAALRKINDLARTYWLKNPLIKRAVYIQTSYVFGLGMNIQAREQAVNDVIQAFLDDEKNRAELTSHQARMEKETEAQIFGNIVLTFFTHPSTGSVRVRSIDPDEIEDIIYNPDDARDPWYYKRVRVKTWFDAARGEYRTKQETTYHPDWRHNPRGGHRRTIGGHPVAYDVPVYHIAVNRLRGMKFGVSEVYAAFDWAKAYKQYLENWATIAASLARFAWKGTTKGGRAGVAAVKTKLNSTVGTGNGRETNRAPAAGSVAISTEGFDLNPIKTSGAQAKADDGRHLKLMISAATGIFEHYFGDPSTGNLATAKAMERPMELMFKDRQALWADVFRNIITYVLVQAAKAPSGKLRGTVQRNEYGEEWVDFGELDTHVEVTFPDLLEKDVEAKIRAIISAATLDGKAPAGLDLKTTTKMLLVALGEDDVDELVEELFPDGWEEERAEKAAKLAQVMQPQDGQDGEDEDTRESMTYRGIREAIASLTEAVKAVDRAQ